MSETMTRRPSRQRRLLRKNAVVDDHPTPNGERCPGCNRNQLLTVSVDDELPIRTCSACHRSFGVDDSLDAETVGRLVDAGIDVRVSVAVCTCCGNADQDKVEITGLEQGGDEGLGVLRMRCMRCDEPLTIDLAGDEPADDEKELMRKSSPVCPKSPGADGDDLELLRLLSCGRCTNNVDALFEKDVDELTGTLTRVRCLVCDRTEQFDVPPASYDDRATCHDADQIRKHIDDHGRRPVGASGQSQKRLTTQLSTEPHQQRLETDGRANSGPGKDVVDAVVAEPGLRRNRVRDLADVGRGDHVAWPKWYAIWHHAIVVDVDPAHNRMTVIHYSGAVKKLDGHFASVRLEEVDVDPSKEEMYRFDYPAHYGCLPADEALERAGSRLGEARYNPLTNNCEHLVRWCKTGRADCGQVRKLYRRLSSVLAENLKTSSVPCKVLTNLVDEGSLFGRDALVAYRKYKAGEMSEDEFRRQVVELGCECGAGFACGTALGVVGQLLIPVPFVGGFIGGTLGSLIGRYLGTVIGKNAYRIR